MNPSPAENRGFTLIELLVVIAIIGILSSVVLASLVMGRLKAADAAIKSNLHTVQTQAELYFSNNNNSYGPVFACQTSAQATVPGTGSNLFIVDATINGALKSALAQSGSGYWAVGAGGGSWAVAMKLKADSGYWWCVDSAGTPVRETDAAMSISTPLHGGAATAASCP